MSNNQNNVLQSALANNELEKFLVGEPFYFQEAKADNGEPQNLTAAFDKLVSSIGLRPVMPAFRCVWSSLC